jgi:hypothetical protein
MNLVRIATRTGWTVRGSNPSGDVIYRTRPDRVWGPHILLQSEYRVSFPEVKRSWRDTKHPPPSSADVKKEYRYTSLPSLACSSLIFYLIESNGLFIVLQSIPGIVEINHQLFFSVAHERVRTLDSLLPVYVSSNKPFSKFYDVKHCKNMRTV